MIDTIKIFLQMEHDNDLFKKNVLGYSYWNYCRLYIYNKVRNTLFFNAYDNPTKAIKTTDFKNIFSIVLKSVFNNNTGMLKKAGILVIRSGRRIPKADYFYDYFTEFISEHFEFNSCNVEFPVNLKHEKANPNINVNYVDYITIISFIKAKLNLKLNKKDKVLFMEQSEFIHQSIIEYFDVEIGTEHILNILFENYCYYKYMYPLMCNLIQKVSPNLIVEVCGYGRENMIINEICHDKNIPTIELQHGVMGDGHIAYNFATKKLIKTFPKYIFLFSDYWKNKTRFPVEDKYLKSVGYPHLETQLKKHKKNVDKDICKILFISQWTISKQLSQLAINLSEVIKNNYQGEYSIIYKLHPNEIIDANENLKKLIDDDIVEVVQSNDKNLYECFSESNVQIGVYSTGLYEGLAFNLKTLIYKITGSEQLSDLVDNDYADYVENAQDIIDSIQSGECITTDKSDFWRSNASDNIIDEINNILDNGQTKV